MTQHLNMYWYYVPQFSKHGKGGVSEIFRRWECCVHNRHSAKAWRRKTAQRRAELLCDTTCPYHEG